MPCLPKLAFAALLVTAAFGAHAAQPPIQVILVGDSTMSPKSGYGDALCARFTPEVSCHNLALGGRSSKSFRAEGHWDKVQALLREGAPGKTYVLVQFGHNDQPGKAPRSTDLVTEFPANMARYAREVKDAGGVPVLVTPLTRRTFVRDYLKDDLMPWAEATRRVAADEHVALVDLNRVSAATVQAMGQAEADTLAMAPPPAVVPAAANGGGAGVERQGQAKTAFDRTHLGKKGAEYFSGMVVTELVRVVPKVKGYLKN